MTNLAAEWHSTKNDKAFSDYKPFSKYRAWWQCSEGHEWEARVAHRTSYATRCPYCANTKILVGFNDFESQNPILAKEWSGKNLITPSEVVFGSAKVVSWICGEGHEWKDSVSNRTLLGRGCPYCNGAQAIKGKNDFATLYPKLALEFSQENTFKADEFLPQSNKKAWWQCGLGHEWEISFAHRTNGSQCPYCANQKVLKGFNDLATTHQNNSLLKEWSPKNTLKPNRITAGSRKKILWVCKLNHEWEATPYARLLKGTSCLYCINRKVLTGFNDLATTHPELAVEWHPTKNGSLTPNDIIGANDAKVWWQCEKGHEWDTSIYKRKSGQGCPQCGVKVSVPEKELASYVSGLGVKVIRNDKKVLGGLELDMYIPEKQIAIEFNGLYWHTEENGKPKWYHHNKWDLCNQKGIQLIQIWGDDWNRDPELIKNMVGTKLGLSSAKTVYARKCNTFELKLEEARSFLDVNHIQGWTIGSSYLGLKTKDNDELVAVLVVKKEAGSEGKTLNIMRYATSCSVPGGFTKLLTWAEKHYESAERIITFSDNTISDGKLYSNNGFVADKELEPDYQYLYKGTRKHKFGYRLKRFRNDPELQYEEGLTEKELARLNNLSRIWDAGKTRWVKTL